MWNQSFQIYHFTDSDQSIIQRLINEILCHFFSFIIAWMRIKIDGASFFAIRRL